MDSFDEIIAQIADQKWEETEIQAILDNVKRKGKLTEEDISAMKPGRDLNVLVAKYVMGHEVVSDAIFNDMERLADGHGNSVWSVLQRYSEDPTAAQSIVDSMVNRGMTEALLWQDYGNGCYSPAEAICKQALLVVLTR